ncbi:MAG: hypothetical protein WD317_08470 [Balneolaceae bacterium]
MGSYSPWDYPGHLYVFPGQFHKSALVGIVALRLVLSLLYRAKFRFFSYYVWALAIVAAVNSFQGL